MSMFKRVDGVAIAALGFATVATAALYHRLPDPIATHFDLHGNPNGWMPRPIGAWGVPAFSALLWTALRFLPRVLPASDKRRLTDGAVALVAAMTAGFMAAVHLSILWFATTPGAVINGPVFVVVGAFLVGLGLVIPRVKRNPLVGIRTAFTLRSDENWARTQRVGGYTLVVGGIVAALAGGFGGPTGGAVAIASMLVAGIIPAVYSLVLARRLDPKG